LSSLLAGIADEEFVFDDVLDVAVAGEAVAEDYDLTEHRNALREEPA
jgi:hypothetical protein